MICEQVNFTDPTDFLNYFLRWNNSLNGFIFRGVADEKWKLIPLSLRLEKREDLIKLTGSPPSTLSGNNLEFDQIKMEHCLLRDFYRLADRQGLRVPHSPFLRRTLASDVDVTVLNFFNGNNYWIPEDFYDVAGLAQHYGVPTRLLDWTYDPFVALYFALKGALNRQGKLCIWCMNKSVIVNPFFILPNCDIKFITPPYFDNPNLNAQQGLFTHIPIKAVAPQSDIEGTKVDRRPLDKIIEDEILISGPRTSEKIFIKVTLPCNMAKQAYMLLAEHGYGSAKMYPGYDGIVQQMEDNADLKIN
ncbi:FRG domain-containing protein [Pantoea sp. FN0305]|uniref:FRG domain-containing protein n=1 Tax=Pantoea sp. FN0305 TaxID=3418559 RepID=UPI003CF91321